MIVLLALGSIGAVLSPDYAWNPAVNPAFTIPTVTVHPPTSTTDTGHPTVTASSHTTYTSSPRTTISVTGNPPGSTWQISVTPTSRMVLPGGSTTFTVAVSGTVTGNPTLYLKTGFGGGVEPSSYSVLFSPSTGVAPFVSTLSLTITSWASPGERIILVGARTLEGGAEGERIVTIGVIVPAAGWDLSVTPSSKDVVAGDPVGNTYTVSITGSIPGNPNIHLHAQAPIAATFEFSANDQPAPFTSTMRVRVDPAAPLGSRTILVYAQPASEPVKSKEVTLVVVALTAWDVSVDPVSRYVASGGSTTFTVRVTGSIAGNPNIHLTIGSPVIVGMTFSFSVNDRPAPFDSTMTVNADPRVGSSDYSRTVIAHPASGATDKTVNFRVIVGTPTASWDIAINPSSSTVASGGSASFAVSITGTSGSTSIQLVGAAIGINWAFSVNNRPAPFDSIMTVSVPAWTPASNYEIKVFGHPIGTPFPGPDDKVKLVTVVVVGGSATGTPPTTDWAVLSVALDPPAPRPGDAVTFSMTMTMFSTTGTFPQIVNVQCAINAASCSIRTVSHPGPVGATANVHTESPWIADAGTHTLSWSISTANDPDPRNNVMTTTFTIFSGTTSAAATSGSYMETSALTPATTATQSASQTLTETVELTTSMAQPTAKTETVTKILSGEILDIVRQNSLPIIAILALLIVILAVLISRRRKTGPR